MFKKCIINSFSMLAVLLLNSAVIAAESTVQLKEVVVTATKTEKQPQDVTQSVTVITADEIKKSGATTPAEVLQTAAGVQITEQGPLGSLNTVRLRGSSTEQVLILLDGQRLNSMRDGTFDLSALPVPLDAVERIEVVRGAASALYGADAMGGVVNIITKKPALSQTSLGGSIGEHGYRDMKLMNSGRQDALSYSLFADQEHSDGYRVNSAYKKENAGLKFVYALDADSSVEASTNYLTKDIGTPGPITSSNPNGISPNANQFNREWFSTVSYAKRFSKSIDIKMTASEMRDTLRFKDPDSFPPTDDTHKTVGRTADLQMNLLAGSWNLITVGGEMRRDELDSTASGRHAATLQAGYIQDEMSVGESLIIVVGGRNDVHSLYGSQWSPKASARYLFPSTGTILRAAYGKSYRAPNFNDLFWPFSSSAYGSTTYVTQGNPNLAPEKAEEYEGGAEQSLGKSGMIRFTAFTRRVKNLIQWQETISNPTPSTTIDSFAPANIGRARISGYEAEASVRLGESIQWSLNYTRMFPVDEVTHARIINSVAPIPSMQAGSTLIVALDSTTSLGLDGRWVRNYVKDGDPEWEYYTLDGKITDSVLVKKDVRAEVFLGVKNIFNRKYEVSKGFPMPPKEFYGGVMASF
jgi:outer membrane cobalamin receptor